ncbi:hypothetical protein Y695_04624 [Hydrogenophaga sp. T4]|nr:hypothetical protein Y695_04624 [Hydrogenophaga sp. T4]
MVGARLQAVALQDVDHALLQASGVDSVEKRKLKSITTVPGITLLAPVPPWMLLTCQLVGGK